jgi:predicted anti-sigma-YlaC factor YlaD
MTCDELRLAFHEDLGATPGPGIREHLGTCPMCRAWTASLAAAVRHLETTVIPAMPLDFSRSLAPALVRERRARMAGRWRWVAAALVVLASSAGGWQLGRILLVRQAVPDSEQARSADILPAPRAVPGQANVVPASLGR